MSKTTYFAIIRKVKILIIGHPGSGKTYLADLLSKKTGIEKIDIDVLFDKHPFYLFSKGLYRKALNKLINDKNDWIIDGYHVNRMPTELLKVVDTIIYLNLPKEELRQNVLNRYKTKKANKEFSHWQSTYANNLKNFGQIRFQDKALKKDVVKIQTLTGDDAKFLELNSRKQIEQFLEA